MHKRQEERGSTATIRAKNSAHSLYRNERKCSVNVHIDSLYLRSEELGQPGCSPDALIDSSLLLLPLPVRQGSRPVVGPSSRIFLLNTVTCSDHSDTL